MDQETSQGILRHYKKELKSLFHKHSLMGEAVHQDNASLMSYTEVLKLLKEKNIPHVNKLMIADLLTSINVLRRDKNVLAGVQEGDFEEFLTKLTDFIVQQGMGRDVPFGVTLEEVIQQLLRGENFYENKLRSKEAQNITQLK